MSPPKQPSLLALAAIILTACASTVLFQTYSSAEETVQEPPCAQGRCDRESCPCVTDDSSSEDGAACPCRRREGGQREEGATAADDRPGYGPPRGRGRGQGYGRGHGQGWGRGHGPGRGRGPDEAFAADREGFHYLLQNRDAIRRKVTNRPDGVVTVTESDDEEVTEAIQEHVAAMHRRIKKPAPIHMRDPLFAELFRHADQIKMKIKNTRRGVRVVETSENERAVQLIQAHAEVVSAFIENGHSEVRKNHTPPVAAQR